VYAYQPGDKLTHAPPSGHESQKPLVFRRQILQENRSIEDKIPTSTEGGETNKQSKHDPIRGGTRDDGEYAADEQRVVEGVFAADHVCSETPEQGSYQHSGVGGDGEAVGERGLKLIAGVCCDDGLDEQDEGIDGIAGGTC